MIIRIMNFPERLRFAIDRRGFTQTRLERQAKLSTGHITRLLHGKGTNVAPDTIRSLANCLNVNYEWLATGVGSMNPPTTEAPPEASEGTERRPLGLSVISEKTLLDASLEKVANLFDELSKIDSALKKVRSPLFFEAVFRYQIALSVVNMWRNRAKRMGNEKELFETNEAQHDLLEIASSLLSIASDPYIEDKNEAARAEIAKRKKEKT